MVLVTGRILEDLKTVCPRLDLFDYVVAENDAVLYDPRTKKETILAARPPDAFIRRLEQVGVTPLQVGRVIVATWLPHHIAALQAIQELGLELHIVFNRSAVMILPTVVNKASGMDAALRKLGLSPQETLQEVANALGRHLRWPEGLSYKKGHAVAWFPRRDEAPFSMTIQRGRTERIRHHRKYAAGDMRLDSFYFTGPGKRHNLKAHDLVIFSQIADGIDEETWLYHLHSNERVPTLGKQAKFEGEGVRGATGLEAGGPNLYHLPGLMLLAIKVSRRFGVVEVSGLFQQV